MRLSVVVFLVALCIALRARKLREKQNQRLRAKQNKEHQGQHKEAEEEKG